MTFIQGKTDCIPSEIGYDEKRLEILNHHFQKAINEKEIQCATYCLSRKGKVFAHGALGKKSFREDDPTPAQPDSIRYIASVTKIITAVALMKLVEDGLTRLDVPVGEILPQFDTPPYNGINLYHLLTHTSGMYADHGCFDNKYQTNYWDMIERAYKLHSPEKDVEFDWIAAALGTIGNGLCVPIGTQWAYCSFGFVILGAVIEKLTCIHAHKFIEDNICVPLGMKDSGFTLSPEGAKRSIVSDESGEKLINGIINGTYESEWIGDKLKIPSTGGGMDGTAYDMCRFGNMVLHKGTFDGVRIIGRKAIEKMTELSIQKPDYCWDGTGVLRDYGIGFDHRNGSQFTFSKNTVMHEGAGACALYIDPDEDMVAAWIVPYTQEGWFPRVMYNTQNIIWSGIL